MDKVTHTVLPFGARVAVTRVDMYGYWGREHHPKPEDVGFHGVIIGNTVNRCTLSGFCVIEEDVTPGTKLWGGDDYEDECMYTVLAPDGRKLELVNHEIEALPSLVTA